MAVPFNDTRRRFARNREQVLAHWGELLDSGIYIGGSAVRAFERAFAEATGTAECVAVANGTDAIELALRGVGVTAGDEVITVANAGGYTSTACQAIGAMPVYVDVDPTTCQLDPSLLRPALSPSTKVVVVTHLYGLMSDLAAIRSRLDEAGRRDVLILEDCAQAHGAQRNGRRAGSMGDVGTFSFYPTKNLGAVGDAGAVVCGRRELADRIRSLAQYGWTAKYNVTQRGGRNSRMDPMQAVVLQSMLPSLHDANVRRREICKTYLEHLPPSWALIYAPGEEFVAHLAVVVAPNERSRRSACAVLNERQIAFDVHYPILDCDQPAWRSSGSELICERSRGLAKRILSLPCFPELSQPEIGQVIDAIRHFT